ncbi:MAG: 4-hydroxy-tetrahydrodipicolinate reductase, partial [Prevotellaceae bacterium]|nr:4-hydroxy-tetrahydrodipicolinate reductase [Prevotellaceae bacterium]
MKIALIGYGKMGRTIERFALERGHQIALRIDKDNTDDLQSEAFRRADVAIEFTGPETAFDNVKACFDAQIPVVSGSTGWQNRLEEARKICIDTGGALLYSSNFSVGVNILFAINSKLAAIMRHFGDYEASITEIHHIHKQDAPSGTAISLAEGLIDNIGRKTRWKLNHQDAPEDLNITAIRENEVPGTHTVTYESSVDLIELTHLAKNRDGFALGAVIA